MDRGDLQKMWREWWDGDIWIAPWEKALNGIDAQQALWSPAPEAHCIWALIQHTLFWRSVTLDYLNGKPGPSSERIETEGFACPEKPDPKAWDILKDELKSSHETILAILSDTRKSDERIRYHLVHDSYHLGQIMYIRRLLGFDIVMHA